MYLPPFQKFENNKTTQHHEFYDTLMYRGRGWEDGSQYWRCYVVVEGDEGRDDTNTKRSIRESRGFPVAFACIPSLNDPVVS